MSGHPPPPAPAPFPTTSPPPRAPSPSPAPPPGTSTSSTPSSTIDISFPGAAVFYCWQVGAAEYLLSQLRPLLAAHPHPAPTLRFAGASAGAVTAILAACGVDLREATRRGIERVHAHLNGRGGLGLVFRASWITRETLRSELPGEGAAEMCSGGRATVVVRKVNVLSRRPMDTIHIGEYRDRDEVIRGALGSVHLPVVGNGRLWAWWRGRAVFDGGMMTDHKKTMCEKGRRPDVYFDYRDDELLVQSDIFKNYTRLKKLNVLTWEAAQEMMEFGKDFAMRSKEVQHLLGRLRATVESESQGSSSSS